jgi:hypothetical protein
MKINKKLKTALLFGVPLLIGGYLIYKQFKGTGKVRPNPKPPTPNPPAPTTGWTRYKVITVTDPLNIRQSPSTTSTILGTLAIDSIIYAKPSSTSGWHEYSADGSTRSGYVSSTYITPA